MNKIRIFECSNCDIDNPCIAPYRPDLDRKTPTECPFNDTPDWMEVA
jgi:hypothetical protein